MVIFPERRMYIGQRDATHVMNVKGCERQRMEGGRAGGELCCLDYNWKLRMWLTDDHPVRCWCSSLPQAHHTRVFVRRTWLHPIGPFMSLTWKAFCQPCIMVEWVSWSFSSYKDGRMCASAPRLGQTSSSRLE